MFESGLKNKDSKLRNLDLRLNTQKINIQYLKILIHRYFLCLAICPGLLIHPSTLSVFIYTQFSDLCHRARRCASFVSWILSSGCLMSPRKKLNVSLFIKPLSLSVFKSQNPRLRFKNQESRPQKLRKVQLGLKNQDLILKMLTKDLKCFDLRLKNQDLRCEDFDSITDNPIDTHNKIASFYEDELIFIRKCRELTHYN